MIRQEALCCCRVYTNRWDPGDISFTGSLTCRLLVFFQLWDFLQFYSTSLLTTAFKPLDFLLLLSLHVTLVCYSDGFSFVYTKSAIIIYKNLFCFMFNTHKKWCKYRDMKYVEAQSSWTACGINCVIHLTHVRFIYFFILLSNLLVVS